MTRVISRIKTGEHSDALRRDDYFPTLVYSILLSDAESLNRTILNAVREERARDAKGLERSNFRTLGGWHSHNRLHRAPNFKPLTRRIHALLTGVHADLGYDPATYLGISTMWSIVNPPGSSNRAHVHPGALWSGVYYVRAPEGAGHIEFTDPRTVQIMNPAAHTPNVKRKRECWSRVKVKPEAGKMLIFPSWLFHSVEPNTSSDGDRVVISFNVSQRPRPTHARQG